MENVCIGQFLPIVESQTPPKPLISTKTRRFSSLRRSPKLPLLGSILHRKVSKYRYEQIVVSRLSYPSSYRQLTVSICYEKPVLLASISRYTIPHGLHNIVGYLFAVGG